MTWIGVVIEEEEKDGERDRAGKDASEALNIPESEKVAMEQNNLTCGTFWKQTFQNSLTFQIIVRHRHIQLPDCKFGKGLFIGGALEVFQGVHCEDAGSHQEPAHLVQEHVTAALMVMVIEMVMVLVLVMVMVMIMQEQFLVYYQSRHPKTLD